MHYLSLVVLLTVVTSCSSTSIKDFFSDGESTEKRNQKLMNEDFKEEADIFDKFKEVKPAKVEEPKVAKIETKKPPKGKRTDIRPPKTNRTLKPRKDKKPKKPTAVKPKEVKKPQVKLEKKPETKVEEKVEKKVKAPIVDSNVVYPEDFPEDLKDMDRNSQDFWSKHTPYVFPGEKMVIGVTYLGMNTGKITISSKGHTRLGEHDAYHFNVRVKTASYYSYLYEVDDYCDSYVKKDGFAPLKFSLIQRQSSQNIDDLQLFDHEKFKVFSFYKRVTDEKKKKKKKIEWIPNYFQDPFSILYFLRGLPMDPAVKYAVPVINSGKVEMLYAQYEKTEKIDTKIGKKQAYRLNIFTKAKGKTLKGGKMTFWFSADDRRIFLKFKAKIKIGSISGDIESYKE